MCGLLEVAKTKMNNEEDIITESEYPLVFDAPLSKIDSIHRRNVMKCLPEVASQVIIFTREKKDLEDILEETRNKIGQEYYINKITEKNSEIKMFFHEEYSFKGKHARYVKILKNSLFNRNVDILILSPILGLVYNRKSNPDTTAENSEEVPTKIFAETMIRENSKILYNYRLCMLLSDEYSDQEKRDNAFKYYTGEDQEHREEFNKSIELYNSYNSFSKGNPPQMYNPYCQQYLEGQNAFQYALNVFVNSEEYKENIVRIISKLERIKG